MKWTRPMRNWKRPLSVLGIHVLDGYFYIRRPIIYDCQVLWWSFEALYTVMLLKPYKAVFVQWTTSNLELILEMHIVSLRNISVWDTVSRDIELGLAVRLCACWHALTCVSLEFNIRIKHIPDGSWTASIIMASSSNSLFCRYLSQSWPVNCSTVRIWNILAALC